MRLWNTIKLAQMTLRLVPEILNPVDVILLVGKEFRMVDPQVLEVRDIQYVIAAPAIRIDNTVRHHFLLDDRI